MQLSKGTQQFKIGRIKYNLPNSITSDGIERHLSFNLESGIKWHFCYRYDPMFSTEDTILDCYTETFNQGIKALKVKVKELESQIESNL